MTLEGVLDEELLALANELKRPTAPTACPR